jgi:ABC-type cobalamin/Fe3+-siderophores transport system ATPase subunit
MPSNSNARPRTPEPTSALNAIEVHGLSKTYPGGVEAVKAIDFEVAAGELFGLLGPNGAGKSTTIGMLTTTIRPTGGSARLAGLPMQPFPELPVDVDADAVRLGQPLEHDRGQRRLLDVVRHADHPVPLEVAEGLVAERLRHAAPELRVDDQLGVRERRQRPLDQRRLDVQDRQDR